MISPSATGKAGMWDLMGSLGLNGLQVLSFLCKN